MQVIAVPNMATTATGNELQEGIAPLSTRLAAWIRWTVVTAGYC